MSRFVSPSPDLQVTFYARLNELRGILLLKALQSVVADADIAQLDRELSLLVTKRSLQRVAGWGLRGETVFPVPYILTLSPFLLGYYRLLLGFSQKQFYGKAYGIAAFKSMEGRGLLSKQQSLLLEPLCRALCASAESLVTDVPDLDMASIHDLTLHTLGPQLRGGALNALGVNATERVFELIRSIVLPAVESSTARSIFVRNAAHRLVNIEFASDPDIVSSQ